MPMVGAKSGDKLVLVGVLKNKRDLEILLKEKWYRIPVRYAPLRRFAYLAFYQPVAFGRQGKRIQYYARITKRQEVLRSILLPKELKHPRAREKYLQVRVGSVRKLLKPIRNNTPRRVSFGFVTLDRLRTSNNILQLYNVPPTEEIIKSSLRRARLQARAQHYVPAGGKRYYLDFAIFCKRGKIAVECDNIKVHSRALQKEKDKTKDKHLRRHGWRVIRLTETDILGDSQACISRIRQEVKALGGIIKS